MIKYNNFEEFNQNTKFNKNKFEEEWNNIKAKKRKLNIICISIIVIIDIISLLVIKKDIMLMAFILFIVDIMIYVVFSICTTFGKTEKKSKELNNEYKNTAINELLENFIDELDYVPLKQISESIYREAQYDNTYNSYVGNDYFEGKINNKKIIMGDINVEYITETVDSEGNRTKEVRRVFNGLFGKVYLEKDIQTNLKITNKKLYFQKNNQLKMDSSEFEKKFNIYTDNQIIGMQILTSDIQEEILELYNKYNINFSIYIYHSEMYVFFETGDMFEVFQSKGKPNEILNKYFDILKFVYNITEKITKTIDDTEI